MSRGLGLTRMVDIKASALVLIRVTFSENNREL